MKNWNKINKMEGSPTDWDQLYGRPISSSESDEIATNVRGVLGALQRLARHRRGRCSPMSCRYCFEGSKIH